MREVKFRGYYEAGKRWVVGSYVDGYIVNGVVEANEDYIAIEEWFPVDRESVGQYIGLEDKKGREIYEGDILLNETTIPQFGYLLTTKVIGDIQIERGQTYLVGKTWQYKSGEDMEVSISEYNCLFFSPKLFKIIGNIHDNPEIVK